MEFVADLHLHSKYSRAVSQSMTLPIIARWAAKKGLDIVSACDFTHPLWLREIKNQLQESSEGLYKLKVKSETLKVDEVRFLLSTEIASIYKQGEKLRRIHNLLFAPNFETVEKINVELVKRGANLTADGRPIIGLSSRQLLELVLSIDRKIMLIPAHIWTPHFGIYGSASGFDSLEEAFGDYAKHIYGIETGLSSDPLMNWQVKELENRSILSFSDAHSMAKMGRETTVFKIPKTLETLTYSDIGKAITYPAKKSIDPQTSDSHRVEYTIEFYPEEGKYHYTGHRNCKVVKTPEEIKKEGNMCPVCHRRLTEGVMHRVEQIANENSEFRVQNSESDDNGVFWIKDPKSIHPPFVKLVPLNEIIAESMGATVLSEKVKVMFDAVCEEFGNEINVLLKTPVTDIEKSFGEKLSRGIAKVRSGDITIDPGFDGEYGHVKIWPQQQEVKPQVSASAPLKEHDDESQLGLDF